jgi:Zn-dependent protease
VTLRYSLTIGRIGGVRLRLHWSWLLVVALLMLTLAQFYRGWAGQVGALALAALAALLLSLSVVAHELAHAAAAHWLGLPVRGVTLFIFGGMTEVDEEALTPGRELLVAAAGPLANLALATAGTALGWRAGGTLAGAFGLHIAVANLLLALLNLLPAYPMDGGRVLRAALWYLSDDELFATSVAMSAGQIAGWALIGGGALYGLLASDLLIGATLMLIGYVLVRSARAGFGRYLVRRALRGIRAGDLMQRTYCAVAPDMRLDQFVGRYVLGQTEQDYPVLNQPDDDAPQPLLGLISARNLRRYRLDDWNRTRVQDAMTPASHVLRVAPDTPAGDAFRALVESGGELLPVIEGDALLGVLRRGDVVRYIQRHATRRAAGR